MPLQLLDPQHQAQLRAGVTIATVDHAVLELIYNSLDAGADRIEVKLETPAWTVQVVDNGRGIPASDFALLGQRYATSKPWTRMGPDTTKGAVVSPRENKLSCSTGVEVNFIGFRGEALASLSQVALVEIRTKIRPTDPADGASGTTLLVLQGEQVIERRSDPTGFPYSSGTAVTLYNLFWSTPVRQRTLKQDPHKWVQRIQNQIETLGVAHPYVTFICRQNEASRPLLHLLAQPSKIGRFRAVTHLHNDSLYELVYQESPWTIYLVVGYGPGQTRRHQYVFFNQYEARVKELVDFLHGVLRHREFTILARSADTQLGRAPYITREMSIDNDDNDSGGGYRLVPSFVTHIYGPGSCYDVSTDPCKQRGVLSHTESMIELLRHALVRFCQKYHISPLPANLIGAPTNNTQELLRTTLSPGDQRERESPRQEITMSPPLQPFQVPPQALTSRERREWSTTSGSSVRPSPTWLNQMVANQTAVKLDTYRPFKRNHSSPPVYITGVGNKIRRRDTVDFAFKRSASALPTRASHSVTPQSGASPLTSRISLGLNNRTLPYPEAQSTKSPVTRSLPIPATAPYLSTTVQLTKDSLQPGQVRVLGQLDKKYIVCRLRTTAPHQTESSSSPQVPSAVTHQLVLIDQHAADERVRLEKLLDDYAQLVQWNLRLLMGSSPDTWITAPKALQQLPLHPHAMRSLSHGGLRLPLNPEQLRIFYQCAVWWVVWGFRFALVPRRTNEANDDVQKEYISRASVAFASNDVIFTSELSSPTDDPTQYLVVLTAAPTFFVGSKYHERTSHLLSFVRAFLAQLGGDGTGSGFGKDNGSLAMFASALLPSLNHKMNQSSCEPPWVQLLAWCPSPLLHRLASLACHEWNGLFIS
ncbi:DNA mismatch repair protein [Dispira parvispora]|uniref:DNA mismatch repair protein n=1 Tax=Dispira parvispora TaxID=1520584 RepID=A0A9W8AVI7_9FUNG|nr:DNA mismatch repair protein [Dispira parvispora]